MALIAIDGADPETLNPNPAPMQFFQDEHFSWKILAVESVVIMLSVVLGFMLNGWRESRSEQERVQRGLQSIAVEVERNQREIAPLNPQYQAVRDSLQRLASEVGRETRIEPEEIPGFKGWRIPFLRSSSFETASSTGVLAAMEYDLADVLNATYRQQRFYNDIVDNITTGLVMNEFDTVEDWLYVYNILGNNAPFPSDRTYDDLLQILAEEHGVRPVSSSSALRDSARTAPGQL